MEGRKKSRSYSLAYELFGPKESPVSSSSGRFESIFGPPPKVVGPESLPPEAVERKLNSACQASNTNNENNDSVREGKHKSDPNKDRSSFYQDVQMMQQPCPLSSSIYYGGQDLLYPQSQNNPSSVYTTQFNKDGGEDDPNFATRGNWWLGSLYY